MANSFYTVTSKFQPSQQVHRLPVFGGELIFWFACIFFLVCTINIFYLKYLNFYYFWDRPVLNLYGILISFYFLSRFVLASCYKAPAHVGYLPKVTVTIPCKNEEESIGQTIDCVYESDYPQHLLEVIAVNDGSTDGTLKEMKLARQRHHQLLIIHFEKNLGKRKAMAAGARLATGEILVCIDSDSFVERNAIRKLVQGFSDPTVGAVCGHANVANAHKNLLTKMQEVRYYVAFRLLKAAESLFSAVSCCSGCFAAYRRKYVMEVLEAWSNQKFLGKAATFGDDRSLTNFILRRYRVIYDPEAVCTTLVPETYGKFFRQQLRWKKSWIRESYMASKFMWRKNPFAAWLFYFGVTFSLVSPLVMIEALVLPLLGFGSFSYLYGYGCILVATLYGLYYLMRIRTRLWVYGILFSLFNMLFLMWQTYYALFTVRKNHWGTR